MNCPSDGTTLLMSERNGVEIDYCPQCRGVWLDRGELDKIMDRARAESEPAPGRDTSPAASQRSRNSRDDSDYREYDRKDYDRRDGNRGSYNRRKKSPFEFLGDLFEG